MAAGVGGNVAVNGSFETLQGTIYNYLPSKEELFLAVVEEASEQATAAGSAPEGAPAEHDALARVLVRECLMGTPSLFPRALGAEAPLVGELEAIIREGMARSQLRDDVPAELLALAIAGLTDLALVQHWASHGTEPMLSEIPELVLTLLSGAGSPSGSES